MTKRDAQELEHDVEDFLQQLEGDREMRSQVNLFKKKSKLIGTSNLENTEALEHDEEEIRLDELLEDMDLVDDTDEVSQDIPEVVVLSLSEAAKTNSIDLHNVAAQSSFDECNFLGKQFSFL